MNKPQKCPSCGGKIFQDKSRLFCTRTYNYNYCKESFANRIVKFAAGVGIKGIGEESALILSQQVKPSTDLSKVFALPEELLIQLLGKNGENLFAEITKAIGKVKLYDLLGSVTMRNVSNHTAELIFHTVDVKEVLNSKNPIMETMDFDKTLLTNIDGVADITADSVLEYFNIKNDDLINLLGFFNPITEEIQLVENSKLGGYAVVLTGNYHDLSRDEFKQLMKAHGAKMTTSVSGKTDVVVIGEASGAAKIKKAKELGTELLTVEEFDSKYIK